MVLGRRHCCRYDDLATRERIEFWPDQSAVRARAPGPLVQITDGLYVLGEADERHLDGIDDLPAADGDDQISASIPQSLRQGQSCLTRYEWDTLVKETRYARSEWRDAALHRIRRAVQCTAGDDKDALSRSRTGLFQDCLRRGPIEVHSINCVILEERHPRLLLTIVEQVSPVPGMRASVSLWPYLAQRSRR